MPVQARVGVAVACYAESVGDRLAAAAALGVTEQQLGAVDRGDADRARLVDRLRAAHGAEAYDAAYSAGRALERAAGQARLAGIIDLPGAAPPPPDDGAAPDRD
jgi:hypothetical protein